MKATAIEFRLRFLVHCVIFVLGFGAPWDRWLHLDGMGANAHLWGVLSALVAKTGVMPIDRAFQVVLVFGIVCAFLGAFLRTWGSAYLGSDVVHSFEMHGLGVMADGPYRHVRNPLYLGTSLATLALALLMPPSGAVLAIVLLGIFQMRLILGEEAFLTEKLGAGYTAYKALVPRLVPSLRPKVAAGDVQPRWLLSALAEIMFWGIAVTFAAFGWQYNAFLLMKGVMISLGASLVVRAMIPRR